jgi:N-acetylglutamate synthase-like GNAT family acetyltransferase
MPHVRTRLRPYLRHLRSIEPGSRRGEMPAIEAKQQARIAELTAVVIIPALRGSGVGRALAEEFIGRCSAAGTPTVELVSASGPAGAAGFYAHIGWTAVELHVTRDGLQVQRFRRGTDRREGH